MTGLFRRAVAGEPLPVPPIWLMRQAGRYHAHYQKLRASHSFEALCRTPELAADVAMGPVDDFDFDAAILFSDLLFPLEALGLGLSYDSGRPEVEHPITADRIARFRSTEDAVARLLFQRTAIEATRARLARDKGLVGFVGGPWTLFVYAVEGSHAGAHDVARASLDLYRTFADRLVPLLIQNIGAQLDGGADVVMVFDTAAGALPPAAFASHVARDLTAMANAFPGRLGYYARDVDAAHVGPTGIGHPPWAGLGLDWHRDLAGALREAPRSGFIQGNLEPSHLLLTGDSLARAIDRFLEPLRDLDPQARRGWVCGLGHGVLPGTPESSVRTFINRVREVFS